MQLSNGLQSRDLAEPHCDPRLWASEEFEMRSILSSGALAVSALSTHRLLFSDNKTFCEKKVVSNVEVSRFVTLDIATKIRNEFKTPIYVYDEKSLRAQAEKTLKFPNANGLTVRFAMKSCPNAAILKLFLEMGINFDASSGYEVERAKIGRAHV